jgi:hypothetical protein
MTLLFQHNNQPAALWIPPDEIKGLTLRCGHWSLWINDPPNRDLSEYRIKPPVIRGFRDGRIIPQDAADLMSYLLLRDAVEVSYILPGEPSR